MEDLSLLWIPIGLFLILGFIATTFVVMRFILG